MCESLGLMTYCNYVYELHQRHKLLVALFLTLEKLELELLL